MTTSGEYCMPADTIHPETAQSLHALGQLHQDQGSYKQAEPLLTQALAIFERVLGPTHPNTSFVLGNLGVLRSKFKPDAQAAKWLHRSAQNEWRYVTEHFPTLTPLEQHRYPVSG